MGPDSGMGPRPAPSAGPCYSPSKLLAALIAFRVTNAMLVSSFFNPDEYWQSLEPAHRLVFGYGHLTWEWAAGVRGYCHPLIFGGLYKLLATLGLDTVYAISRGPSVLQGVIAAACDLYVYRISCDLHGSAIARWTLLCQMASWFNWYCLVRTFSNSVESTLLTAAVFHLGIHLSPSQRARAGQRTGLLAAALSVVIRPACLPFWGLVGLAYLAEQQGLASKLRLFWNAATVGGVVLGIATVIDRICYGRWVLVLWEFAKFNLLEGGSSFYGSHPWHWNFTQGLPAVASSYLPFILYGGWSAPRSRALWAALVYATLMSLPAHKEFRFLLPCLQLLMPMVGQAVDKAMESQLRNRLAGWAMLGLQAAMAAYFSSLHQSGAVAVMAALAEDAHFLESTDDMSVLFLMPCHATPFYASVHRNISLQFPDCSPPGWEQPVQHLNPQQRSFPGQVKSQSLRDSPQAAIQEIFSTDPGGPFVTGDATLPTHVVMFSGAAGLDGPLVDPEYTFPVQAALNPWGFYLKDSFLHNLFDQDEYLVLLFAR